MSDSNRVIIAAIGLVAMLCASALADPPSQQGKQWESHQNTQSKQQETSPVKSFHPDIIDWLSAKFGVTGCGPYSVDRFGHANKIKNDEYYRACDLEAQESSANSTRWLLLIAAFQTMLAVVGTVLVWRSLRLTRKAVLAADNAVEVTRYMGRAQVRAYLDIKKVRFSINSNMFSPEIEVFVVNSGQSPAFEVEACFRVVVNGATGVESKFDFFFELPDVPSSGEKDRSQINGNIVFKNSDWGRDWENVELITIQVAIFAYSVFDEEISVSSLHANRWIDKKFELGVVYDLSRLDEDSISHPKGIWLDDAQKGRKRRRTK